ncbi:UNVERIFIED_CONTAM: hypothetical protein K2H54_024600, partial [Gekko kuhli]
MLNPDKIMLVRKADAGGSAFFALSAALCCAPSLVLSAVLFGGRMASRQFLDNGGKVI